MRPFLPALLLGLFWGWSGTFQHGVSAAATGVGVLALLATAFWGGSPSLDPLGLDPKGRWLPALLYASILASWWLSTVPRAGWTSVVLLPSFLMIPAMVERCWRTSDEQRLGHLSIAAVLLALSGWSWVATLSPDRFAQPLGHHLLWVAVAVSWIPWMLVDGASTWPPLRWTAWVAGLAAISAVLGTRSLLGVAGLVGVGIAYGVLLGVGGSVRRLRWALLWGAFGGLAIVGAGGGRRLLDVAAGVDSSWLARRTYWEAGLSGWLRHPWVGWGPGSTAWTLGFDLRPRPGINPAGEVVADLHSVPLQLLREVGIVGVLLVLAVLLLWIHRRISSLSLDSKRGRGALPNPRPNPLPNSLPSLVGLGAVGIVGLAGVTLGTSGIWVGLAVLIGAARAPSSSSRDETQPPHLLWRGYAVVAALLLAPNLWAIAEYDGAVRAVGNGAPVDEVNRHLERALRLDPRHPLYRARAAALDLTTVRRREGDEPLREAPASAPYWLLAASHLDGEARREATDRVISIDPFDWAASFSRLVEDPDSPEAARWGAHAILVEPRLVAADFLRARDDLRRRIAVEIREWPGVAAGLRVALAQALTDPVPESSGAGAKLVQTWDETIMTSPSLHIFRRTPWPTDVVSVPVDLEWAAGLEIPSASILLSTERDALSLPDP